MRHLVFVSRRFCFKDLVCICLVFFFSFFLFFLAFGKTVLVAWMTAAINGAVAGRQLVDEWQTETIAVWKMWPKVCDARLWSLNYGKRLTRWVQQSWISRFTKSMRKSQFALKTPKKKNTSVLLPPGEKETQFDFTHPINKWTNQWQSSTWIRWILTALPVCECIPPNKSSPDIRSST